MQQGWVFSRETGTWESLRYVRDDQDHIGVHSKPKLGGKFEFLHVSSEILVICGDMHGNMNPELFLKLGSHTALLISAELSKKRLIWSKNMHLLAKIL